MTQPDDSAGWQRLDPRMLLVDPVRTLGRFAVPILVAFVGVGSANTGLSVTMLPLFVGVALLVGMLPWLTTHYRMTATQLQVRRGLLQRTTLTAPLDRIRSVDLEASLLRRLLSVTKVQIGTGVDDKRISLDALSVAKAHELRHFLLAASGAETAVDTSPEASSGVPAADERELARIDWSWLRFAPFSLSRLVIVAGAIGALSQFADQIPLVDAVASAWRQMPDQSLLLVIAVATVVLAVAWVVVAVGGYVVQWWDMRLTRGHGQLRLTAGLFTTRATSVEERRLRGVQLVEPALLRLVRGAELNALATGVGSGGVIKLLPPCPRPVGLRVGDEILETPEPLTVPLLRHGLAARRRCHVRAQRLTLAVGVAAVAAAWFLSWSAWVGLVVPIVAVGSAIAAELRYGQLGHQLTADHLVSGTGALERRRTALERDGIIGWVVAQTWFQRRVGLATLIATTAAGPERVVINDVPLARALAVADAATPGLLSPFLE